jgi:PAS domain-containing protein
MEKAVPSEEGEALLADRNSTDQAPAVLPIPAQIALWELDLTTNQVHFSPEFRRQLGAEQPEPTNGLSEWESRLHPEDRERVTQGLQVYLSNPGPYYEARYRLSAPKKRRRSSRGSGVANGWSTTKRCVDTKTAGWSTFF